MSSSQYEQKESSLEKELRDLQERSFEISLKYAEVEVDQEQLARKLKAVNNEKKWF